MLKPSNIPLTKAVEYGVPFEDTNPTYVQAGKVEVLWDDFEREEEIFNSATDLVEAYARLGFFGGFILRDDFKIPNEKVSHVLEVWVTDLNT